MKTAASVLVLLALARAAAQELPDTNGAYPDDSSTRRTISQYLIGTVVAGSLIESYYSWWKDAKKPFTFYSSNWFGKHKGIDKIGHLYGGYMFFYMSREIMLYGGHDEWTANAWGLGLSAFHSLSIEIGDAFSPYGFDYQDLIFGLAGIGYGYLQTKVDLLNSFNFKFSYWSAEGLKSPANFTKDYDALTIWLAFDVDRLLPDRWEEYWPDFLGCAIGYSVDDRATKAELAFALDFNLDVFTIPNEELTLIQRVANKAHWPAPGVKFTEKKKPRYSVFLLR